MKNKINYLLSLLLLLCLAVSCSSDSIEPVYEPTIEELTTFSVDNNNIFIDNKANLIIDVDAYSAIQVTSTSTNVTITKVDDLNYTISSTEVGSELIYITVIDNAGNQLKGIRRMYFYEHGTKDYNTVEGITIDVDASTKLEDLHGVPDGKTFYTIDDNEYENWYYFSKGFYFTVSKFTNTVIDIYLFGDTWSRTIDSVVYTGSVYPYELDGLSTFNSENGLLMDEIVEKYGERESEYEYTSSRLKYYLYTTNLNDNLNNTQYSYFFFYSDDNLDEYTNQKIYLIHIS